MAGMDDQRVAAVLDIRLDVVARWRGGELDRLVNARHSGLHESVATFLAGLPAWQFAPEVSFSVFGERGVIDILVWHAPSRTLLVIELKTDIVDVQELVATFDRKRRLAVGIARERGWRPALVGCWVIVTRDRTSQRRIAASPPTGTCCAPRSHMMATPCVPGSAHPPEPLAPSRCGQTPTWVALAAFIAGASGCRGPTGRVRTIAGPRSERGSRSDARNRA